ncbi:MAG TPA: GNAT family N-acetyltransferase [Caulobacteraceae bacterium]|nr:GNAT family N-acetyltransferase [Caulobacteraceae bacterium]
MVVVRPAVLPRDASLIAAIDTAFTTLQVYRVDVTADSLSLVACHVASPITKRFPLDDLENPARPYDHAWVALAGERAVGFAATSFEPWNRRLVLWHLYVDAPERGRGVARRLLDSVEARGAACGARHLWLETSSLNAPGVAAYRALGFSLTGVDLTLYDGTPAEGESALFFSRPLAQTSRDG